MAVTEPATKNPSMTSAGGLRIARLVTLVLVSAVMTLLPILNITSIVTTQGMDNLSNDYLQYVGLIDQVLRGNYQWGNFITDTFYRTHSVALPVLLHIADAQFFHFDIFVELIAGVVLTIGRLALLWLALGSSLKGWQRMVLCPVLALLIFSESQISVFCFGDGVLTIGLSLFGFALGLWGLTQHNRAVVASTALLLGGLIASFSWGNGLITWMVLLLGLVALRCRKPMLYIAWLIGFALSILPYVQALIIAPMTHAAPARNGTTIVSLFNVRFMLNVLGWPFVNNIGTHPEGFNWARTIGLIGLGCFAALAYFLWNRRKTELWVKAVPALVCIAHGLLSIWQISVFRSLVAAWYTAVAMSFWIGMIALVPLVWEYVVQEKEGVTAAAKNLARVWCIALPLFVTGIYLSSNLTYEDKTDMYFARSPASASALRHYLDGPTYGEPFVFQWGAGNPGLMKLLAQPLDRHQLSVFAPNQKWTLQGDYLLDTVKVKRASGDAIWTAGISEKERLPWSHYKHLNLLLPSPGTVSWTITLPNDATWAEFRTAVTSADLPGKTNGHITFKARVDGENKESLAVFHSMLKASDHGWHDLVIPLAQFKGRTITIQLGSTSSSPVAAVFRFPQVEVHRPKSQQPFIEGAVKPSNTNLSPQFAQPSLTDLVWKGGENWKYVNAASADGSILGTAKLPTRADLAMPMGQPVELSKYGHFCITAAATKGITPRLITVAFDTKESAKPIVFQIPLLADEALHDYTYDLKLLELPSSTKVTGVKLSLVDPSGLKGGEALTVHDVRLMSN